MINNKDNKNPFGVPENYFQSFNMEIMDKLPEKEAPRKVIPLWKTISKWSAAAAIVAGIATFGINYMESNLSQTTNTQANKEGSPSIESEYYNFLEQEATQLAYIDSFYSDDQF